MAASLVNTPFSFRMPAHLRPRLFERRRAAPIVRHAFLAQTEGVTAPAPAPHAGDSSAWTAEEQNFLRTLREAGL